MVEYKLLKQVNTNEEKNTSYSYGISVYENNVETQQICDISQNEDDIRKLIDKFNMYELSPVHLSIMIEDFLYNLEA